MKKILIGLLLAGLFHASIALAAVNINSADANALEGLPGIGPSKSAAIVDYRRENGDFESLDGLTAVDGIGSKTVDGLRDDASIGSDD